MKIRTRVALLVLLTPLVTGAPAPAQAREYPFGGRFGGLDDAPRS